MVSLEPLGDRAYLAQFATEREAAAWVLAVRGRALQGVTDVVLAYRSAAVFADPDLTSLELLEHELSTIEPGSAQLPEGKTLTIPVWYDGPDLDEVALRLKLDRDELVAQHASTAYDVFAIGFLQGFPYAGYLPPCALRAAASRCPQAESSYRLGRHRRPSDGHLSSRIARRLASAGSNPDPDRRPRR